jgi:hypothetical protein
MATASGLHYVDGRFPDRCRRGRGGDAKDRAVRARVAQIGPCHTATPGRPRVSAPVSHLAHAIYLKVAHTSLVSAGRCFSRRETLPLTVPSGTFHWWS